MNRLKILFSCFALISSYSFCNAQLFDKYGLITYANIGTQLVTNPEIPSDGTFAWDYMLGWGAGIYGSYELNNKISIRSQLNYLQKGFRDTYQTLDQSGQLIYETPINRLHYFSLDGLIQYKLNKKNHSPYLLVGIRSDFLLKASTDQIIGNPQGTQFIENQDFNRIVLSGVTELGIQLSEVIFIEGGINFDITPSLLQSDARLKGWLYMLSVGFNLRKTT